MSVRTFALGLVLLTGFGCASTAPGGDTGGDTRRTGTVAVVGSAPMNVRVLVRGDDGQSTYLSGALLREIQTLAGARVEVQGPLRGGVLEASGYQVVSVDGRPVVLGMVERSSRGGLQVRRSDGSVVELGNAPPQLKPGQKVWVQGVTTTQLQVQKFGVVRP